MKKSVYRSTKKYGGGNCDCIIKSCKDDERELMKIVKILAENMKVIQNNDDNIQRYIYEKEMETKTNEDEKYSFKNKNNEFYKLVEKLKKYFPISSTEQNVNPSGKENRKIIQIDKLKEICQILYQTSKLLTVYKFLDIIIITNTCYKLKNRTIEHFDTIKGKNQYVTKIIEIFTTSELTKDKTYETIMKYFAQNLLYYTDKQIFVIKEIIDFYNFIFNNNVNEIYIKKFIEIVSTLNDEDCKSNIDEYSGKSSLEEQKNFLKDKIAGIIDLFNLSLFMEFFASGKYDILKIDSNDIKIFKSYEDEYIGIVEFKEIDDKSYYNDDVINNCVNLYIQRNTEIQKSSVEIRGIKESENNQSLESNVEEEQKEEQKEEDKAVETSEHDGISKLLTIDKRGPTTELGKKILEMINKIKPEREFS